jgi:hypothetical protein
MLINTIQYNTILSWDLTGGVEENHENFHGQIASTPRFDLQQQSQMAATFRLRASEFLIFCAECWI